MLSALDLAIFALFCAVVLGFSMFKGRDGLSLRVVPPDAEPYRLILYVLDYDRNGRAAEITLSDEFTSLGTEQISAEETAGGIYLTWTASGTMNVELKKKAGHNTVLSGVFVDPAVEKDK